MAQRGRIQNRLARVTADLYWNGPLWCSPLKARRTVFSVALARRFSGECGRSSVALNCRAWGTVCNTLYVEPP
jgi:hypothetical protein